MCTQSKMPLVHNYDMQMSTTHTRGFWYKKSQPKSFQCVFHKLTCVYFTALFTNKRTRQVNITVYSNTQTLAEEKLETVNILHFSS